MNRQHFLAMTLILLLMQSCSLNSNLSTEDSDLGRKVVGELEVTPGDITITELNTEISLSVLLTDKNNDSVELLSGVEWISSNESLLTINAAGKIKVHASGKVSVSANYEGISESVEVVINESGSVISGKLLYQDKRYSINGFETGVAFNEVRYVTVDLLDVKNNVLESVQTDSQGKFEFGFVIPDEYSIRALAQVNSAPAAGFSVRDMSNRLYSVRKNSVVNQTEYVIKISETSGFAGAFNILDVMTSASEFSLATLSIEAENLPVYWEPGNFDGTYYCPDSLVCRNSAGIYVADIPGDTDEYDDDVLLHEFGHFLMKSYFVDDSPAGCHFITDNDLDLRLSWSEGWSTFFAAAVKSRIKQLSPESISSVSAASSYVDTDGIQAPLISYDISDPSFENEPVETFDYASSEFAVSNILWSVYRTFGMTRIGDVLGNYFPETTDPTSLPSFWQGMLKSDLFISSELPALEDIFAQRRVFYREDEYEDDDDVAGATMISVGASDSPEHYLYKDNLGGDVDLYSVDVIAGQTYAVATSDLRNGIDTYLRIIDLNGDIVVVDSMSLENDDIDSLGPYRRNNDLRCIANQFFNTPTALASSIQFTADLTERLFVEVSHISSVAAKFDSVGPFGTYRLEVSLIE